MSVFNIIRKNGASFSLLVLLFVLPFVTTSGIVFLIIKYEELIRHFTFIQWVLLYTVACLCMAFAITHTTFIALVSGYFLGMWGLPYTVVAYFMASLIGYWVTGLLDKGKFFKTISSLEGVDRIMNNLKRDESKVIFLARLSPVLPFAMTNALLSFLKADLYKFLFAGFWGMLPRTLFFIWIGSKAAYIKEALEHPQDNSLEKILFTALLFASIGGIYYYFNKSLKNNIK